MKTVANKTQKPLSVPLPRGKVLHLGPGKTGQISSEAAEHPRLKKLVDAGEIEVFDEPEVAAQKIMSATTDSFSDGIKLDPKERPGVFNLVQIYELLKPGSKDEILAFLKGKIANWWLPDDVVFVGAIPHTATGKIQKTVLRDKFKDHVLPTVSTTLQR